MKILIAAGGTGGHVYPALAIAQELKRKNPNVAIVFVGTRKGFEAKIVPDHGFPMEFMEIGGIHSVRLSTKIKNIFRIPKALWDTHRFLQKHSPQVVLGIGGYVSGLLVVLASLRGIHTAILECNVVAGMTNRALGKFAEKIYLAFEESRQYFPAHKCVHSGNPIRNEILATPNPDFTKSKKTIFIFGGSQGAKKINQAVVDMIQSDPVFWKSFSFIHQTGPHGAVEVASAYQKLGIESDIRPYFDHIDEAYAKAHFVIARAGSSILEIAAIGLPSVLVPYPYAAGHQLYNAEVLVKNGAAYLLKDDQCTGQTLGELVRKTFSSPGALQTMSMKALTFRHEHASEKIAEQFLSWMK